MKRKTKREFFRKPLKITIKKTKILTFPYAKLTTFFIVTYVIAKPLDLIYVLVNNTDREPICISVPNWIMASIPIF